PKRFFFIPRSVDLWKRSENRLPAWVPASSADLLSFPRSYRTWISTYPSATLKAIAILSDSVARLELSGRGPVPRPPNRYLSPQTPLLSGQSTGHGSVVQSPFRQILPSDVPRTTGWNP